MFPNKTTRECTTFFFFLTVFMFLFHPPYCLNNVVIICALQRRLWGVHAAECNHVGGNSASTVWTSKHPQHQEDSNTLLRQVRKKHTRLEGYPQDKVGGRNGQRYHCVTLQQCILLCVCLCGLGL